MIDVDSDKAFKDWYYQNIEYFAYLYEHDWNDDSKMHFDAMKAAFDRGLKYAETGL